MSDSVINKIENEVNELKSKVADRLKETEEIADLEIGLGKQTSGLVRTTEEHQDVSRETRNKFWLKWAKYTVIIILIIGLLFWVILGSILKTLI